jgi:hypothetical protein
MQADRPEIAAGQREPGSTYRGNLGVEHQIQSVRGDSA